MDSNASPGAAMPSNRPEFTMTPSPVYASVERALRAALRRDDLDDRDRELGRELEVALVVGRHRHDGAGAVAHEHVVADPDGDRRVVHRVHGVGAGEDAGLLLLGAQALDLALAARLVLVGDHGVALPGHRELVDQRVLRRQHHVGGAEQRVGARREHREHVVAALQAEVDLGALAATDPVGLHELDLLGPVDGPEVVQQALRVVGDAEVPLPEVLLGHQRCRSASSGRSRPARWRGSSCPLGHHHCCPVA